MAVRELGVDLSHGGLETEPPPPELTAALEALEAGPRGAFLALPGRRDLLRAIGRFCRDHADGFTDVVQIGIGGSSLGARALCEALRPPVRDASARRSHFPDNVDPDSFGALLERLHPRRTLVHVVSQSGGTLETLAQLHALLEAFSRRGRGFSPRRGFAVTTGPRGPLRDFAREERVPVLEFPEQVAGRYSVFTASGLLTPALLGLPVGRVLAGARRMLARCPADARGGPAGRLAALFFEHERRHRRPIHVDFVYADALRGAAEWFAQLWAESLGKAGRGPTPVVARGTTDQHSQLQLYVEGPDDKVYTLIRVERFRIAVRIGRGAPLPLAGRPLARVLDAEARGTRESLLGRNRPLVELTLPSLAPEPIGELLMMRQLQTALAGALYGVDPFNQPGVEAGKVAALRFLSS